jgi:hypothetical protein
MPVQVPVFKREIMNHMYSPSAYYFARTISGMLVQVIAPILSFLTIFFGLGIKITLDSCLHYLGTSLELTLVGCAIGYMCGLMFDDDNAARGICMFFTLIFMLVSGGLNNAGTYPPVIKQLQYISPNRYATELYFRVFSDFQKYPEYLFQQITEDEILQLVGLTKGYQVCHLALLGIFVMFYMLGWLAITVRNRKF